MKKAAVRKCFTRQPIHYIILDISPPMDLITCENFCLSLRNVMLLVISMRGTLRFPAIGLSIVGPISETLFPVQPTRGNFPQFYSALQEILKAFKETVELGVKCHPLANLNEALEAAIKQHRIYCENVMIREDVSTQLEIAVFSKLPLQQLTEQLEEFLTKLDVTNLKKVCAIGLLESVHYSVSKGSDNGSPNSEKVTSGFDVACSGIVDQIELFNDKYTFDNFFKGWLHDCSIDSENLHLILPGVDSVEPMVIKCDVKETLLNPVQLPFVRQFFLNADQSFWPQLVASPLKMSVASRIYRLKALTCVKLSGICESVVYGMPFLLHPTCCWKIEWSEIENNRQMFFSLCDQLKEKEEVLIVKLVSETNNLNSPALDSPSQVEGHFALFPCANNYFLIKSIVNNEILLPNTSFQTDKDICSEKVSKCVATSLNKLGKDELYNPLHFDSKIFECLFSSFTKNKPFKRNTAAMSHSALETKNKNKIFSTQNAFCKASDLMQSDALSDNNSGFPTQL